MRFTEITEFTNWKQTFLGLIFEIYTNYRIYELELNFPRTNIWDWHKLQNLRIEIKLFLGLIFEVYTNYRIYELESNFFRTSIWDLQKLQNLRIEIKLFWGFTEII